ncbi:MAG: MgtC/SapB family protein [Methylophilus sp.]
MMNINTLWLHFAVALGIGLIIGTERERSKSIDENRAVAGVRTFAIASLLGATSYMVSIWLHIAILICVMIFVAVAYFTNQSEDSGLTTEISLLFTVILGGLTMTNSTLAASLGIVTALLLLIKKRLHGFVLNTVTKAELYEFLMLSAATLIILPIVPNAFIGPFDAVNPRNLWLIVIFVMAINAIGHLALRLLGQRIGLPIVGFVSGFISSIATIGAMGERAKKTPTLSNSAVCGATFSSLATIFELSMILAAIHTATLNALKWSLIFGGVAIASYGLILTIKSFDQHATYDAKANNSFSLKTALMFASMIAIVLIVSAALKAWFGQNGLIIASGVAGLADSHAPSITVATMAAAGKINAENAVIPILVALSLNTCSKALIAIWSGSKAFAAQVILGLIIQVVALWVGWWFF